MLTHNTANSAYVHQEIGCALTVKKLVIPLVQPAIGHDQLAMLAGVEYIEFDFDNPHAGVEGFATAIRRVAEKQRKQSDVETLLAIALCVALLVVLLSDGGAGMAPA